MSVVEAGKKVAIHFSLNLESGELIDSTREKQPAEFQIGDGNLPEGFEKVVIGMEEGQRQTFRILPEQAFGMPNPNNVQNFPRSQFANQELSIGLMMSFSDASKSELSGVITSFDEQNVEVDFNHPLAGKTLLFDVEVLSITS